MSQVILAATGQWAWAFWVLLGFATLGAFMEHPLMGLLMVGVVGMVVCGTIPTARAQTAGYQIQQRVNDEWQVFRTPKGNYAQPQSEVVCNLDLASAANAMPKGTILACRRAIKPPSEVGRQPTPILKGDSK